MQLKEFFNATYIALILGVLSSQGLARGGALGHGAFTYENGVYTLYDLGDPLYPGGFDRFTGINDSGQIVGRYAFLEWGFLFANGVVTDLPYHTLPKGINNSGQILLDNSSIYANGMITLLPPAQYTALNNTGALVGLHDGGPFLYANGVFTSLSFPVPNSIPFGINNAGDIAGSYSDPGGTSHGFLYSNGVFTTIDMPGMRNTFVLAISNNGYLAGIADVGGSSHVGFLYASGSFTMIQVSGVDHTEVFGVNSSGVVVGEYNTPNPEAQIPEPASFAMIACGLTAVGTIGLARSRRRTSY